MTDDTMGRLATAQKNIEALRKQAVIATGESLGFASRVVESGKQDFIGTLVGLLASFDPSSDLLRDVLAKNAPLKDGLDPDKKKPGLSASERNVNQLQFHLLTKQLQTAKELADVTKTESQQRAAVVKLLRDQADMLDQIRDIEYDDLKGFDTSGDITESELARWSQRNALQKEANGLRQQAKALSGGGLSAADRIRDKASGINDPANNDGFLEAGEGVTAGLQSWVVATGIHRPTNRRDDAGHRGRGDLHAIHRHSRAGHGHAVVGRRRPLSHEHALAAIDSARGADPLYQPDPIRV